MTDWGLKERLRLGQVEDHCAKALLKHTRNGASFILNSIMALQLGTISVSAPTSNTHLFGLGLLLLLFPCRCSKNSHGSRCSGLLFLMLFVFLVLFILFVFLVLLLLLLLAACFLIRILECQSKLFNFWLMHNILGKARQSKAA